MTDQLRVCAEQNSHDAVHQRQPYWEPGGFQHTTNLIITQIWQFHLLIYYTGLLCCTPLHFIYKMTASGIVKTKQNQALLKIMAKH